MLQDDIVNVNYKTGLVKAPIASVAITYTDMVKNATYGTLKEDFCGYELGQILDFISELVKKYAAGEVVDISKETRLSMLKIEEYQKFFNSVIACIPNEEVRNYLMKKWEDE